MYGSKNMFGNDTRNLSVDSSPQVDFDRLKYLADNGTNWYWETDVDHRLVALIGGTVDPDTVLGRTREDVASEDDLRDVEKWNRYRQVLANREPIENFLCEVTGVNAAWITISGTPMFDENNIFCGYRGVGQNITAKIIGKQKLENSLQQFKQFVERSPLAVFVQQDRVIKYLNNTAVELFELENGHDIIGQSITSLIEQFKQKPYVGRYDAALRGELLPFIESQFTTRDGKVKHLESSIYRTEWGGEQALISIFWDITNRTQAEAAIRESREELRGVMDGLADAVILVDSYGKMLNLNLAATTMFGYERGSIQGSDFSTLLPPDSPFQDASYAADYITNITSAQLNRKFVVTGLRSDGSSFPLRLSMSRLAGRETETDRLIVSIADISREREMEEALFQAQKMEAIGHLTGGIAHDFNNLLQVISGANSILHDEAKEDERLLNFTQMIERSVANGSRLTGQLLAYARQQSLHPELVAPDVHISEMAEILRRTISENITLEIISEVDLPSVMIDGHALQNAVLNLCNNAKIAMPNGGQLAIHLTRKVIQDDISVGDEIVAAGTFIDIAVRDTGTGMTKRVMENAFDPFFSTRPVGVGTGLGLSMVQGFARQSGGFARIDSVVGEGTSVHLVLPEAR
jgi:PAS domain S-box-containing protein